MEVQNFEGAAVSFNEEDKLDFIKSTLAKLSPEQTQEIHKILLQDPLLKDVPPSADSETISRYHKHIFKTTTIIYYA